ncbi:MAG: cell envelope integrity protein CreD [Thiotrichaceae bacterium]
MNKVKAYLKPLFIVALIMLLLIPQTSIMNLISERNNWHADAMSNIEKSWPGKQIVAGPFLAIPYEVSGQNSSPSDWKIRGHHADVIILIPEQLDIQGNLQSHLRSRGIHKVPVYDANLHIKGSFSTKPLQNIISNSTNKNQTINWKQPVLSYLIKDQRGITSQPVISWNKTDLSFTPGFALADKQSGMHVKMAAFNDALPSALEFSFNLNLQGMQQLEFSQTAKEMRVNLDSDWPHPGFIGAYLPTQREISNKGFTANWRSSAFSNHAEEMQEAAVTGDWSKIMGNTAGVNLVQPVDAYHLSERSIKYAQLLIILTFVAMVLFELFKKLRIHPIQYAFIGIELTLFYLLLISLSEHLSFGLSYALATLASTGLLTLYFIAILKSKKTGSLFGGSLIALYAVLYGILQAEDHALLMGSLLIFAVLALLMLTTRHINWYQITESYHPSDKNDGDIVEAKN